MTKEPAYTPPFTVSAEAINLIAQISAQIERYAIHSGVKRVIRPMALSNV